MDTFRNIIEVIIVSFLMFILISVVIVTAKGAIEKHQTNVPCIESCKK